MASKGRWSRYTRGYTTAGDVGKQVIEHRHIHYDNTPGAQPAARVAQVAQPAQIASAVPAAPTVLPPVYAPGYGGGMIQSQPVLQTQPMMQQPMMGMPVMQQPMMGMPMMAAPMMGGGMMMPGPMMGPSRRPRGYYNDYDDYYYDDDYYDDYDDFYRRGTRRYGRSYF